MGQEKTKQANSALIALGLAACFALATVWTVGSPFALQRSGPKHASCLVSKDKSASGPLRGAGCTVKPFDAIRYDWPMRWMQPPNMAAPMHPPVGHKQPDIRAHKAQTHKPSPASQVP